MSQEDEARRALKRLEEQSEKVLGAAPDQSPSDDKIEVLGKRIARIIAYALAAFLIYWLWKAYL
jgi:hypothetical protein